jgi:hypothetical protein
MLAKRRWLERALAIAVAECYEQAQLQSVSIDAVDFSLTQRNLPHLQELVLARGDWLAHFALHNLASILSHLRRFEVRRGESPARLQHLLVFPYRALESLAVQGEIDDDDYEDAPEAWMQFRLSAAAQLQELVIYDRRGPSDEL